MPQRTDDPYPFRVNCAATACATIDSVLRAIPARHRIFEPAVNPVEDFRRPVYVILEGRRIRGAMRKETVKPVPAHCEAYTAGRWRRCVAADARQSTPKCAEAVPPSLDRSSRGTAKTPLAEAKRTGSPSTLVVTLSEENIPLHHTRSRARQAPISMRWQPMISSPPCAVYGSPGPC